MTENEQMIERLSRRMLRTIEARLEAEEGIELKDYKTLTGALKELKELVREAAPETKEPLVVRFVGDAEEYAR